MYKLVDGERVPLTQEEIATNLEKSAAAQASIEIMLEESLKTKGKLTGVLFSGVMCSATEEDMWGLAAIRNWIVAGNSTPFKFSNGNVLVLTPSNLGAFEDVWAPFRASFFTAV